MRHYDPTDKYDIKDAKELKAPKWMLNCLEMNPDYVHWGPDEDCMWVKGEGWTAPIREEKWSEFDIKLDDLNEVVNFYFQVNYTETHKCEACDGGGYNPETKRISDDWYDFNDTGRRWMNDITQDEVDALVAANRLWDFTRNGHKPTALEVNSSPKPLVHDAINKCICIETRARRLGVWGKCTACKGKGQDHLDATAILGLVLWLLHPRKGASRGVEIRNIKQEELPQVYAFLREAANRNANRFSKIPEGVLI